MAGGYPADFLDTLAVGEQSGKIVESMGRLAKQYQDRARSAMAALAVVAGVGGHAADRRTDHRHDLPHIHHVSICGPINDALKI